MFWLKVGGGGHSVLDIQYIATMAALPSASPLCQVEASPNAYGGSGKCVDELTAK